MLMLGYVLSVIFSGIAILFGMVLFVYLIAVLADRVKFMNYSTAVLTPEEVEERRVASSLTRQAGLAGMLSTERTRVIRIFFEERSFAYENIIPKSADKMYESSAKTREESETKEKLGSMKETSSKSDNIEDTTPAGERSDNPTSMSCAICLNEYDNGDKVITGTSCSHVFHYECCMQWIEKNQELCPYCRKSMMSPEELFEAAKQELGEERVQKLKNVNLEAASRMAALQDSLDAARGDEQGAAPDPGSLESNDAGFPSGGEGSIANLTDVLTGDIEMPGLIPVVASNNDTIHGVNNLR